MDEESLSKEKNLNEPRVQFDDAAPSPPSRRPQRPPTPRPIVPGKRSLENNEEDDDDGQTASPSARPPTQPRPRLRSPSPALDLEEPAPEDDETSKNSSQLGSTPCTQSNTPAAPPSTPTQPSSDDVQFTQPLSLETSCTNTTAPSATPAATSIALSQPSSADTSQVPQLSIVQRRAVSYSQVTPTSSSMLNTPEQDMLRRRALIARLMGSRSCGTEGRDMHHHRHALHPPNQFDSIDIEHARNARLQSTRGTRTGATIESGDDSTGEPKESVSTSSVGEDLGFTSVWPWESHGHQKAKDDQDKGQVDNTRDSDHIVDVHHDGPLKPDDEPLVSSSSDSSPLVVDMSTTATSNLLEPPQTQQTPMPIQENQSAAVLSNADHRPTEDDLQRGSQNESYTAVDSNAPDSQPQKPEMNPTPIIAAASEPSEESPGTSPTRGDLEGNAEAGQAVGMETEQLHKQPNILPRAQGPLQSLVASPTDNYRRPVEALHSLRQRIATLQARANAHRASHRQQHEQSESTHDQLNDSETTDGGDLG